MKFFAFFSLLEVRVGEMTRISILYLLKRFTNQIKLLTRLKRNYSINWFFAELYG